MPLLAPVQDQSLEVRKVPSAWLVIKTIIEQDVRVGVVIVANREI